MARLTHPVKPLSMSEQKKRTRATMGTRIKSSPQKNGVQRNMDEPHNVTPSHVLAEQVMAFLDRVDEGPSPDQYAVEHEVNRMLHPTTPNRGNMADRAELATLTESLWRRL